MRARHLAAVLLPVALVAAVAWSQSVGRPARVGSSSGPTWSRGFTTDGGVSAASMQSDTATVGAVDAGAVNAGSLSVTGPASFGQRPTGIFFGSSYVRGAGLPLTTLAGWTSLAPPGTVITIPGVLRRDACQLTDVPAGINLLNLDFRCVVTGPNTIDIQFKALLGLTLPAGAYYVLISGPNPAT